MPGYQSYANPNDYLVKYITDNKISEICLLATEDGSESKNSFGIKFGTEDIGDPQIATDPRDQIHGEIVTEWTELTPYFSTGEILARLDGIGINFRKYDMDKNTLSEVIPYDTI